MKKNLLKIADISGWILLALLVFYFASGYSMVKKYGMDSIMSNSQALFWHKYLAVPFLIFLFLHILPYFIVRKQVKKFLLILSIVVAMPLVSALAVDKIRIPEAKPPIKSEQENKIIKCPNCPKGCEIKPGEAGECQRYENINGKLQPVEKK